MNNSLKLPSIDYKEFKILTLCKNKEFANINHMAEELKVTTRSVRTYIKQLNENLGEDIAQIIYVKGYGYKLEIKNKEAFELDFGGFAKGYALKKIRKFRLILMLKMREFYIY